MKVEKFVINAFKSGTFSLQPAQGTGNSGMSALVAKAFDPLGLNILTPKQMLQRLSIPLTQVKSDNTSENLLNEILQLIYSLYRAKEITKKICDNTINLI